MALCRDLPNGQIFPPDGCAVCCLLQNSILHEGRGPQAARRCLWRHSGSCWRVDDSLRVPRRHCRLSSGASWPWVTPRPRMRPPGLAAQPSGPWGWLVTAGKARQGLHSSPQPASIPPHQSLPLTCVQCSDCQVVGQQWWGQVGVLKCWECWETSWDGY